MSLWLSWNSFCRPGWPQTYRDPPAFVPKVLDPRVCATTTPLKNLDLKRLRILFIFTLWNKHVNYNIYLSKQGREWERECVIIHRVSGKVSLGDRNVGLLKGKCRLQGETAFPTWKQGCGSCIDPKQSSTAVQWQRNKESPTPVSTPAKVTDWRDASIMTGVYKLPWSDVH
jgi:ribosomal protein L37E